LAALLYGQSGHLSLRGTFEVPLFDAGGSSAGAAGRGHRGQSHAGDSIVAIDNLEAPLGGELLCSATTEAMLSIRVLGLSKNVLVPNSAVFFATGNAMTVIGDMVRRSLSARLDPRVERPELRKFTGADPVMRAKRDRALYVVDVLTVLRA
jgi:putative DNA primase/helicase